MTCNESDSDSVSAADTALQRLDHVASQAGAVSASAPAALPQCDKTACPDKCTCATQHCAKEIEDCLADGTCNGGESCALACPCGSMSCLAGCAAKHPSAKGFSVLSCVTKNCPNAEEFVPKLALAPAALPQCDKTACPDKCTCATQHCAKEIEDCLADGTCNG